MRLFGKAGGGEQTVVQVDTMTTPGGDEQRMSDATEDDHTMKTEAAADAWSTTGEDDEEQCDLDEGEVLEFEDEACKTFAHGGESSTVEQAAEEGFLEHDPAGAVVIDNVPAFSEEGEQSSVMDSVGGAEKLVESDAEEVSSCPAERRRIEP